MEIQICFCRIWTWASSKNPLNIQYRILCCI
jgi:hypothetical protein